MCEDRPSQKISAFINFLETSKKEGDKAKDDVDSCSKRNFDYLHEMEFAKDKSERNKIATKIQRNQISRRKAKDKNQIMEPISKLMSGPDGKAFIGKLRKLVVELEKEEKYVYGERHYTARVGEPDEPTT